MRFIEIALVLFLIVCAIASIVSKKTLTTVLIYMAYSLIMSVIWILLQAPDLAITEAAVGAGINSVLLFVTLKKVHDVKGTKDE